MDTLRAVLAGSLAAFASLAIGCGPPAAVAPAPLVPVTPATATTPEESAPSPPPAAEILATEDGWVRVPQPQGGDWECHPRHVESAAARVRASFIQCVKETPAGTISLMAKDYQVATKDVMTAEALSTIEYPKHYRKRWDHVNYTRSGAVDHHGQPAYECAIDLSRDGGPSLHIVERVIVVDNHTLNLSADAPPEVFKTFAAEVKRWFDGADFRILHPDPSRQALL